MIDGGAPHNEDLTEADFEEITLTPRQQPNLTKGTSSFAVEVRTRT